jgi:enoyl-CoA hydratase
MNSTEGKLPKLEQMQIRVEDECIAVLMFNNPEKLNAFGPESLADLHRFLDFIEQSVDIRAAIVTGAGDKAFTAGMDVSQFVREEDDGDPSPEDKPNPLKDACDRIENHCKPVIAAINGYCIGGGVELAAACDIRIAAENAVFKLPEVGLGIIPGAGGIQRIARATSVALAKELALTARKMKAWEAYEKGLVAKVVPAAELMDEALSWARQIAQQAPLAVRYAKEAANMAANGPRDAADAFEREKLAITEASEDAAEGARSFFEKRPPEFKGR